jgi:hypothetical protein
MQYIRYGLWGHGPRGHISDYISDFFRIDQSIVKKYELLYSIGMVSFRFVLNGI